MLSAPKSAAEPYRRAGMPIYFAAFSGPDHEMRALNELYARSPHRFTPPGIARGGVHWLFGIS